YVWLVSSQLAVRGGWSAKSSTEGSRHYLCGYWIGSDVCRNNVGAMHPRFCRQISCRSSPRICDLQAGMARATTAADNLDLVGISLCVGGGKEFGPDKGLQGRLLRYIVFWLPSGCHSILLLGRKEDTGCGATLEVL